jgi:hypothetical protein
MDVFVIITMAASNSRGVGQTTMTYNITVTPEATRDEVFKYAYEKMTNDPRCDVKNGTVVFYSAELNRFVPVNGC